MTELDAYPELAAVDYARERLQDALDEFRALLNQHWMEFHGHPPKFNWEVYKHYEDVGALRFYTARQNGALVGYIVAMVFPYIHETDWLTCFEDVFYLKPELRGGGRGRGLFEFMHADTEREGVRRWRGGYRLSHNLRKFYDSMGYGEKEVMCERIHGEAP